MTVLYRKCFSLKTLSIGVAFKSFEFTDCMINYSTPGLRLVVVYRPPASQENELNETLFLEEFATFLEMLAGTNGPLLITGDFNFHLDVLADRFAIR